MAAKSPGITVDMHALRDPSLQPAQCKSSGPLIQLRSCQAHTKMLTLNRCNWLA